jgi:hypothetical protein
MEGYVVSTSVLSLTSFANSHLMVDICCTHDSHNYGIYFLLLMIYKLVFDHLEKGLTTTNYLLKGCFGLSLS